VAKLVAGGGLLREVFICDQCVAIAGDIMKSHDEGVSQPPVRTGWFRRLVTAHRAQHRPVSTKHQELAGLMS